MVLTCVVQPFCNISTQSSKIKVDRRIIYFIISQSQLDLFCLRFRKKTSNGLGSFCNGKNSVGN